MSITPSGERLSAESGLARVGTTLKQKYFIEKLLGAGGMSFVYAAMHRYGHRVAVKVLRPEMAGSQQVRDRFLREGYLANRVLHPAVVRVMDDDVADDGSPFLVMELLEGESLDARAEKTGGKLPPRLVVDVALQLLDVLAAAHAEGIVHRDIKPDNLVLSPTGVVRVVDFGVARLHNASTHSKTGMGVTLGTPAFMAPEQALGRQNEIDARTDVWGVGATMFRLLTGHYVHEGQSPEEQLVYAGSRPARSLADLAPDMDPRLVRIVDRALAFDRRERWVNSGAMAEALTLAFGGAARRANSDTVSTRAVKVSSRPPAPIIAALGGEFSIVLDVDVESGFEWVCDGPVPLGAASVLSCDAIPVPGAGPPRKKMIWTFRAEKAGQCELTFRHVHPLEPAGATAKVYRVQVAGN